MGKWIAAAAGVAFAIIFPQAFIALAVGGVLYVGFCWAMERMNGGGK